MSAVKPANPEIPTERAAPVHPRNAPERSSRPRRINFGASVVQNLVLAAAIVVLAIFFYSQNQGFLSLANIRTVGETVAIVGVLSIVQTVLIVCGVIDISVGSMTGACSVVSAIVFTDLGSSTLSLLAAVGCGLVLGAINGITIVYGRVNPIIATLGTYSAYQGLALVLTDGQARGYVLNDPLFVFISRGTLVGIPIMVWLLIVVAVIIGFVLKRTDLGRNIYAIGGNDVAARLAGISINRYLVGVYLLSGVVAAVAGIMLTAYTGSGNPVSGSNGLELQSITAAALGGAVLAGGKGGVGGTIFAVTLIGTLDNGLTILNISSFYQYIAQGALLIIAVVIQKRRAREPRIGRPT
nr:ABC transporter permease [Streptomyces canus]